MLGVEERPSRAPSRAGPLLHSTSPRGGVLAAKVSEKGEVKGDYPREDAGQKQHSGAFGDGVRGAEGSGLRYRNGGRYDGGSDQGTVINREFQKIAGAGADRQQAAETVGRSRVALISADRKSEGEKEDQPDASIGRGPQ